MSQNLLVLLQPPGHDSSPLPPLLIQGASLCFCSLVIHTRQLGLESHRPAEVSLSLFIGEPWLTVRLDTEGSYMSMLISGSVMNQDVGLDDIATLTLHTPDAWYSDQILSPRCTVARTLNVEMRALWVELWLVCAMQTDYLMSYEIPPWPQSTRQFLAP